MQNPDSAAGEPDELDESDDRESSPARARRPKRKPKPKTPKSEAEIDSPKPLTVGLLAVMALLTLTIWGSARLACNERSPLAKKPRELALTELAGNPKDAAIEQHQRVSVYDFQGALQLSKAAAAEAVRAAQQRLCSDASACERKRDELRETVRTTGALLERNDGTATVRVRSSGEASEPGSFLLKLEREGELWKVVERRPAAP